MGQYRKNFAIFEGRKLMKELIIKLYEALSARGDAPKPYGEYHLWWIIAVVIATLALTLLFSRVKDKTVRIIIASAWAVMLIFELLKQFVNCMYISEGEIVWRYNFGAFPYHLCSTPLYILPMVAFMKDGRRRNTAIVFLATFAVIGGIAVYIAPDSVLGGHKLVDFQSMLHHGIQICIGLYIASRYRNALTNRNFASATLAFLLMTGLAIFLNVMLTRWFEIKGISSSINLFFVNPYERYVPPVLAGLGIEKLPYLVFLFGYIAIFTAISFAFMKGLTLISGKNKMTRISDI